MISKQSLNDNLRLKKPLFLLLIFLFITGSLLAQSGSVDLTFNASVSTDMTSVTASSPNIALQPDGKVLVFGNFQNVNGAPANKIVRLNSDGSADNSFSCVCTNFTNVKSVLVQPDGKIIIAGDYIAPGASFGYSPRIARLNADGSVDATFTSPFNSYQGGLVSYYVELWDIQADGKIFVTLFAGGQGGSGKTLYRLNTDGSIDNSFPSIFFGTGSMIASNLYKLKVLPDGKIMMSASHNFGPIFRLNPDGTKDNSFESPILTGGNPNVSANIGDFEFQSDGKIVISGSFVTVNGVPRQYLARLNPNGSLDQTFQNTNPAVISGGEIEVLSNNKILVKTLEGAPNSVAPYFFRLNADGSADNTFTAAATPVNWRVDGQDRIVFTTAVIENGNPLAKVRRMNANGSLDDTFVSPVFGFAGEVTTLARQSDGKILIGGVFNRVDGVTRRGLARVNPDGSLDNTFNAGSGVNNVPINVIVVQPDGKILIGGYFDVYNGTPGKAIFRLNSDGSLDTTFTATPTTPTGASEVKTIALQADGKILIGGDFTQVNGVSRTGIARLNADGSLDNSFNPLFGSPRIYSILPQSDGTIMVGGTFGGVNGFNRTNFVRLNADGSLDTSFNAGSIAAVLQILRQTDGKYLVLSNSILRRNADGSADSSFNSPTLGTVSRMLLQPDGNIIVVGNFSQVGTFTRNNIARLRTDGALDTLFFPIGSDRKINDIIAQPDGKLIIGGSFSSFENVPRSAIARITPPSFRRIVNFDYDGDGRADVSVFRPSENKWYVLRSSDGVVMQQVFAIAGDVPVPSDYDGDGKTDIAIYRPSSADWWSLSTVNGNQSYAHWGEAGVIARPSDFDGDGKSDYIFFLPANSTWYRFGSSVGASYVTFGLSGDKPITGDFDGDGKSDVAIYRPSTGDWWWKSSIDGVQRATHWGISTDIPAPADYDADGKTDFAVYRPSNGTWYIYNSSTNSSTIMNFGIAEDKPVAADYDGDGKADIAVFRPSTGVWYLMRTTTGFTAQQFGVSSDIPTEYAFVP
jgi:uncharacterized delta-60 repeat protein